jgi:hypothetical protein
VNKKSRNSRAGIDKQRRGKVLLSYKTRVWDRDFTQSWLEKTARKEVLTGENDKFLERVKSDLNCVPSFRLSYLKLKYSSLQKRFQHSMRVYLERELKGA